MKEVSEEEQTRLNELAGNILREAGLDMDFGDYTTSEWIEQIMNDHGYADYYLHMCCKGRTNEADATVYQRLVDIDTTLGLKLSLQLWCCLFWTTSSDVIKV